MLAVPRIDSVDIGGSEEKKIPSADLVFTVVYIDLTRRKFDSLCLKKNRRKFCVGFILGFFPLRL